MLRSSDAGRSLLLRIASGCVVVVALSACIDGHDIRPDAAAIRLNQLDVGQALRAASKTDVWPVPEWWRDWRDPQLDGLMQHALADSPTLAIVRSRVTAAVWEARALHANELPSADAAVDLARTRFARYDTSSPPGGMSTWNNSAALDLSYDLDLWGKYRATERGAKDEVGAALLDVQFATVELEVAIARTYNQLALQYALLDIYVAINDEERRNLEIANKRRHAGIGTEIEIEQASAQSDAGVTDIRRTENDIALARLQLAYLVGEGPGFGDALTRPASPETIRAALPSSDPGEIVEHRPDIVAQRWRIAAAAESIKAAHADFYPDIRLVAYASLASVAPIGGFFNFVSDDGLGHGVGVTGTLPVFDADRRRGHYGVVTAEYDDAVLKYNEMVYAALHGVAQRVASMQSLTVQSESALRALASSKKAYQLADRAYRGGLTEYLDVLIAQKIMLQQQIGVTLIQSDWLEQWILLMKELGGGAHIPDAPPMVSPGGDDAR